MDDAELKKYCIRAVEEGITHARPIDPATVVTAPWVRMKCQFGCPGYDRSYCCPPHTPTPDQTRSILDSYRRAILFHIEAPYAPDRGKRIEKSYQRLVALEGEIFKDGYYRALLFLAGPCRLCKECARLKNEPCTFGDKARPSMEACGIDVYATARNNGFPIQPLRDKKETQNHYCLMLVD
ncbi:MAG: DUF2284 domain-containing protein [Chloroflexi bacterium]|nr:DUF2284 domain-containing protein [Chloroflexota bacterium]